jgi:tRNA/tmRNA/rRNA uracil-C5-methylase (TrmA/RlmC/RlmD family)
METISQLYKKYLESKTTWMILQLETVGFGHLCRKITPSPLKKGFRNRAKFQVYENKGVVRIEGTDPYRGVVPFDEALWILPSWARRIVKSVADYREEYKHDFPFDGFELQLTHGRQQAHIIIAVKKLSSGFFETYAKDMWKTIPELIGVAIPSQRVELGDVFLDHWILGRSFFAHYDSFFQSNLSLTPRLLDRLASEAKELSCNRIIDLYCGVGLLSLSIATKNCTISGVDSEKKSVDCALQNALRLGFESTSFKHSKVGSFIRSAQFCSDSLVLVNPPRAGCESSVIDSIAQKKPRNILCVSCDLETHVRDLKLWLEKGYMVSSISAFDMFPFTPFLETVTRLTFKQ